MDYGRWSDRIFTKKKKDLKDKRKHEAIKSDVAQRGRKARFRSFVRRAMRGKIKT